LACASEVSSAASELRLLLPQVARPALIDDGVPAMSVSGECATHRPANLVRVRQVIEEEAANRYIRHRHEILKLEGTADRKQDVALRQVTQRERGVHSVERLHRHDEAHHRPVGWNLFETWLATTHTARRGIQLINRMTEHPSQFFPGPSVGEPDRFSGSR